MSITQLYTKNYDQTFDKVNWHNIKTTGLLKLLSERQKKELKSLLNKNKS